MWCICTLTTANFAATWPSVYAASTDLATTKPPNSRIWPGHIALLRKLQKFNSLLRNKTTANSGRLHLHTARQQPDDPTSSNVRSQRITPSYTSCVSPCSGCSAQCNHIHSVDRPTMFRSSNTRRRITI